MKRLPFGVLLAIVVSLVYPGVQRVPVSPQAKEKAKEQTKEQTIAITSTAASSFFTASYTFVDASTTSQIGPANYAIYAGEGTFGKYTGQGVSQSAPVIENGHTVACTLPDGSRGIKFTLVGHVAVTRFERTGDLLFEKGDPGALNACVNFAGRVFHETGEVTITGGTGRFAGASGNETVDVNGGFLETPNGTNPGVVGLPGIQGAFGFASGTFIMKFTVPK